MKGKISCSELLEMIPEELLDKLEEDTKVNYQVKKLKGKIMFKLLLSSLINSERVSQRVMEEIYNSEQFSVFSEQLGLKTKHTSISDRLSQINYEYFKKIFEEIYRRFNFLFNSKELGRFNIIRFDSTLVGLSSKLLNIGMQSGKSTRRQIKFTIGLNNLLPSEVVLFKEQEEVNENIALGKAIKQSQYSKDSIAVFDRGLQKRQTFCDFNDEGRKFVSRLNSNVKYKELKILNDVHGQKTETLVLDKDIMVYLKDEKSKWVKEEFRLITAKSLKTNEEIVFLSNIMDLDAREITEIYKRRWDIEVFFRFIKQELNFKHLVSRNENGIKVMLYMTLIVAILLLVYKKQNKITSYKIAKIRFSNELEMEIIKEIVILCKGDISLYYKQKKPT